LRDCASLLKYFQLSFNQSIDEVSEELRSILLAQGSVFSVKLADSRPERMRADGAGSTLVTILQENGVLFVEVRSGFVIRAYS